MPSPGDHDHELEQAISNLHVERRHDGRQSPSQQKATTRSCLLCQREPTEGLMTEIRNRETFLGFGD
jgi:hypothetical protein